MMVHEQLKKAREARGLSLAELGSRSGVRMSALDAIERGSFDALPSGLYGRHAVRAYASAVGIDPGRALEEVAALLPQPEDPLDGLARVRGLPRRHHTQPRSDGGVLPRAGVSDDMADADRRDPPFDWRVPAASLVDGAVLAIPVLILVKTTAVAADTSLSNAAASALPAWALIAALVCLVYFVLLGGIRNATVGTRIAGVSLDARDAASLDATSALRRGLHCALRESSILVDCLLAGARSTGWLRTASNVTSRFSEHVHGLPALPRTPSEN